jgi:hypothetical protein
MYGYCPKCSAKVNRRERRLNGNDTCVNGCVFPSKDTLSRLVPAARQHGTGFRTPDPKYNIAYGQDGKPVLVNAATGVEVDEPIFILRAKDEHAIKILMAYATECRILSHVGSVLQRMAEFITWRAENKDKIKEPDTK